MSKRTPRMAGSQMSPWREPRETNVKIRANDTEIADIDALCAKVFPGRSPRGLRSQLLRMGLEALAEKHGLRIPSPDDHG